MITLTRQLPQTTIYANDFQDNVYSFPVDSVINTATTPGKLVITTSEGYLLTTSSTSQPKREQSLAYKQQDDGQWAVHSIITIRANNQGVLDGLVRLQNSQAGTTVLTIQGESTALARIPTPSFTVSETVLSFAKTAPGQPKSLIFSISQQNANERITITSDTPEYFLLATDKHPTFTASLTVEPSQIGLYVHVRYLAKKAGIHSGQLLIQSTFDEQTIALSGRTAHLLSTVRNVRPLNGYAQSERRSPATWLKIGAVITLITVAVGLAWFGFMNRQAFFAGKSTPAPTKPAVSSEELKSTNSMVENNKSTASHELSSARSKSEAKKEHVESRVSASKKQSIQPVAVDESANKNQKVEIRPVEQRYTERKETVVKPTESLVTKRPYRQARPVPAIGESELEKELNQLTPNQP